ncbi:MAG: leucine-rich repeat domain-containing protein, partial [Candidatus Dadabacteria bacterium]|nr:leucine-rich repeat domain-containing protein [Candidatus Dadabacteria bacterium]
DVLKKFYCETDGPNWTNKTNWGSSGALSTWYGVIANNQGKVFALLLRENMLSGSIPPELGSLTDLGQLYLNNNMLSGSIPPELGSLTALRELYLNNNELSGEIPPELGSLTALRELYLSHNMLSGSIPPELGRFISLDELDLSHNMLSGSIPPELVGREEGFLYLFYLTELDLSNNELSGKIPEELGDLTNLEQLHLHENELSGEIPEELDELPSLVEISIWSNPEIEIRFKDLNLLGNDRTKLRYIYNANNGAQWKNNNNWLSDEPLGDWYGVTVNDNGKVTGLDLQSNNLRGPVDGAFSGLLYLGTLNLSGNCGLTGELPLGLMRAPSLKTLNLGSTGVGVPDNEDFRDWLAGISFTSSSCVSPPRPSSPSSPSSPPPSSSPSSPLPESDFEGLQEDRGEDGLAISPGGVGTSLIVISREEARYITIELSVMGNEYPEDLPSIILSPSLLERVEAVSFSLSAPSEEELPEGLRLEGFVVEAGIGNAMLGAGETVTVCLPAGVEESTPRLYRYEEQWNPLSGSVVETVNGNRSVCADVSFLPSLFGVFVEIPGVMEESAGGCSVASGETGRGGSFNVAFNLFLIMFGLVGVFRRRRRICVHRAR